MEEDGGEAGDDGKRWLGLECLDGPSCLSREVSWSVN